MSSEFANEYYAQLLDLTFNSKPLITALSQIAGEHVLEGAVVVELILRRIQLAPADQQLPLFYLIDSIVKNEGHTFRTLFLPALPGTFVDVYMQNATIRPKLRNLVKSWMPVGGAGEGVFPIATIATLLRQMDSIDGAAAGSSAVAAVSSAASLLGGLSAALGSAGFAARGAAPPIVNPLAMPMSAGPVFMPRGAPPSQPVASVGAGAAAAATPAPPVFPHQLLEVLQPTLENAKRVPNDSARVAAINLRTLVDVYTRQVNAAAGRATPSGPSATLFQRLIAHRQGAPLELSDLMPSIVPGWTPPVVQPSANAAAAAAAASSRKRAHGTGVTNLPDNLGLLRAGGAGMPIPMLPQMQQQQQPRMGTGAMMDPARAKAIEAIERAREKRHRTDLERHHAPTEFSANYLKSEHEFVIFGMYEALKAQCGECGLRFPESGEQSRKHADWHFEINRRDKQRLERPSSRQWYAKPSDWTSNVDGVDAPLEEEMLARLFETSKPLTASTAGDSAGAAAANASDAAAVDDGDAAAGGGEAAVPSDDARSVCPICSDKFEEFWSEADDQWMFRGAMYDAAGRIVHQKCARAEAAKLAASGGHGGDD